MNSVHWIRIMQAEKWDDETDCILLVLSFIEASEDVLLLIGRDIYRKNALKIYSGIILCPVKLIFFS